MEDIERDYGEDAQLEDAIVCIEVRSTDDDDEPISTVEARSLGRRNTVEIGILTRTLHAVADQDYEDD